MGIYEMNNSRRNRESDVRREEIDVYIYGQAGRMA